MPKTPVPEENAAQERPRVAAALQRARSNLVGHAEANALDVARGVLMPVLQSLGVDVFDLGQLQLAGEATDARVEYRLSSEGRETHIVVVPADAPLPGSPSGESLAIVSNGRQWRFGDEHELELFDEEFAPKLGGLLNNELAEGRAGNVRTTEANEVEDTGEKSPPPRASRKEFVPAGPLERITLDEVRGHAAAVRNMRGKLQVWFDDEPVDITSRSAFYYVLAELALRHGREDAIPGEDLIVPPDEAPDTRHAKPLARPGWQLLLDHDAAEVEERTIGLLEALGLLRQFRATQRGEPYPLQAE